MGTKTKAGVALAFLVGLAFGWSAPGWAIPFVSKVTTLPNYDPVASYNGKALIITSGEPAWSLPSGDVTGTFSAMSFRTGTAVSVLGNASSSSSTLVDIPSSTDYGVLQTNGGATGLSWALVGNPSLANASAVTVKGNPNSGAGTEQDIAASAGNQSLMSNSGGTGLAFGQVLLSSTAVTGALPITGGGTAAVSAVSGFANLSPLTTKGDLLAFGTANVRLAVGTTGQILQTSAAATDGVAWVSDKTGSSTGDTACVGCVGEIVGPISRVLSAATGITTSIAKNIASPVSLTITPGTWQIHAAVFFSPNGTTSVSQMHGGVSATSGALPSGDTESVPNTAGEIRSQLSLATQIPGINITTITLPVYTVATATSKTLYLVAESVFTVSTMSAGGWMEAVRIR